MGDVAMTSPVVSALREKYPDVNIILLTRPFFRPFFRNIPNLSFVDLDLKGRHKGFRGMIRLYREIKAKYKVDYVADLHDVIRSKTLTSLFRLTGAEVAVIDKGRTEKKRLTRSKNKVFKPLTTTVERYADVFGRLGFDLSLNNKLKPSDDTQIPDPIINLFGDKDRTWIGISPFAQHRGKTYPVEKTERIVRILSQQTGLKMFVFGGGELEKNIAEEWELKYTNVHSVIGKLPLNGELDLISHLDVMLSMDSSAMHMSSLVGVPAVSIWGATHPYAGFMGYGQSVKNVVQLDMDCRPCSVYGNKPCIKGNYPCLNEITADMVINTLLDVIAK